MPFVGYRPLKANSNDQSGNGYNGTDTTMAYVVGSPLGGCAYFATAKSSYISLGNCASLELSPDLQIGFFVNMYDQSNYCSFDYTKSGGNSNGPGVYHNSNTNSPVYAYVFTDGSNYSLGNGEKNTSKATAGVWYFFVISRDTTGAINIRKNGVKVTTTMDATKSGAITYSSGYGYIGRTGSNNVGMKGYIAGMYVNSSLPTDAGVKNKRAFHKGFF